VTTFFLRSQWRDREVDMALTMGVIHMKAKLRSLVLAVLALAATAVIATVPGVAPQVALLATTALIMGGAGHPLGTPPDSPYFVDQYTSNRLTNYVNQSGFTGSSGPDNTVVVITPEARILGFGFDPSFTFRGIFDGPFDKAVAVGQRNLDNCIEGAYCKYNQDASTGAPDPNTDFIVYGYSQSSSIATMEKIALMERYPDGEGSPKVSFVLTANGNRPSGGILTRGPDGVTIPIIGLPFGNPTPTNSAPTGDGTYIYETVDVARQYDGWADQPLNPLNPFAEVNSIFGQLYLHVNYDEVDLNQGEFQDQVGDTTYYLIPTPILPMLMPLESVPVVGHALADTLDPFFRVLVESGYDRTISPGTPTTFNLLYFPNPVDLVHNLGEAIPTGLDNGISDLTDDQNNRPLGTERPDPYGVGGPPVNVNGLPEPLQTSQQLSGDPVVTAGTEDVPEPDLTPPVQAKRPVLTALTNGLTRTQAQGEVRQNPLVGGGSTVLLEGASGAGSNGVTGPAGVGSPLKQLGDAVKSAVDSAASALKPKAAATDTAE
jgi:PE-PPE domain